MSTFKSLETFAHPIQQCVLTIVVKYEDKIEPVGTGFIISPDGRILNPLLYKSELQIRTNGVTSYLSNKFSIIWQFI